MKRIAFFSFLLLFPLITGVKNGRMLISDVIYRE